MKVYGHCAILVKFMALLGWLLVGVEAMNNQQGGFSMPHMNQGYLAQQYSNNQQSGGFQMNSNPSFHYSQSQVQNPSMQQNYMSDKDSSGEQDFFGSGDQFDLNLTEDFETLELSNSSQQPSSPPANYELSGNEWEFIAQHYKIYYSSVQQVVQECPIVALKSEVNMAEAAFFTFTTFSCNVLIFNDRILTLVENTEFDEIPRRLDTELQNQRVLQQQRKSQQWNENKEPNFYDSRYLQLTLRRITDMSIFDALITVEKTLSRGYSHFYHYFYEVPDLNDQEATVQQHYNAFLNTFPKERANNDINAHNSRGTQMQFFFQTRVTKEDFKKLFFMALAFDFKNNFDIATMAVFSPATFNRVFSTHEPTNEPTYRMAKMLNLLDATIKGGGGSKDKDSLDLTGEPLTITKESIMKFITDTRLSGFLQDRFMAMHFIELLYREEDYLNAFLRQHENALNKIGQAEYYDPDLGKFSSSLSAAKRFIVQTVATHSGIITGSEIAKKIYENGLGLLVLAEIEAATGNYDDFVIAADLFTTYVESNNYINNENYQWAYWEVRAKARLVQGYSSTVPKEVLSILYGKGDKDLVASIKYAATKNLSKNSIAGPTVNMLMRAFLEVPSIIEKSFQGDKTIDIKEVFEDDASKGLIDLLTVVYKLINKGNLDFDKTFANTSIALSNFINRCLSTTHNTQNETKISELLNEKDKEIDRLQKEVEVLKQQLQEVKANYTMFSEYIYEKITGDDKKNFSVKQFGEEIGSLVDYGGTFKSTIEELRAFKKSATNSFVKIGNALGLDVITFQESYKPENVAKIVNQFICGAELCTKDGQKLKNSLTGIAKNSSGLISAPSESDIVSWLGKQLGKMSKKGENGLEIMQSWVSRMYQLWIGDKESVNGEDLESAYQKMLSFCGKTTGCLENTRKAVQKVAESSRVVLTRSIEEKELDIIGFGSLDKVTDKIEKHKSNLHQLRQLLFGKTTKRKDPFGLVNDIKHLKKLLGCNEPECKAVMKARLNYLSTSINGTRQIFQTLAKVLGIALDKIDYQDLATDFNQKIQNYLCGKKGCGEGSASISKFHEGFDEEIKKRIKLSNELSLPDLFNAIASGWKEDLQQLKSLESLKKSSERLSRQVKELETTSNEILEAKKTLEKQNSEHLQRINELDKKIVQLELGNNQLTDAKFKLEKSIEEKDKKQKQHEKSVNEELEKLKTFKESATNSFVSIGSALGLENFIQSKTQYEPNDVAKSINNFICGTDECTEDKILKKSLTKFARDLPKLFDLPLNTNIVAWLDKNLDKIKNGQKSKEIIELWASSVYRLWIGDKTSINKQDLESAYQGMLSFCGKTADCLEATRQAIQKVAELSRAISTQKSNELSLFSLESLNQVAEKIKEHNKDMIEILKLVNGQEVKEHSQFDLVKVIVEALKGVLKCEKEPCNNNVEAYFKETEQIFNKIAGILGIELASKTYVGRAAEFNQEVQKYLCGDVKCEETIASISKLHKGLDEKLKSRINLPEPLKPPNNHSLPDLFNAIAESWKKDLEQLESLESLNKGSEELGKQVLKLNNEINDLRKGNEELSREKSKLEESIKRENKEKQEQHIQDKQLIEEQLNEAKKSKEEKEEKIQELEEEMKKVIQQIDGMKPSLGKTSKVRSQRNTHLANRGDVTSKIKLALEDLSKIEESVKSTNEEHTKYKTSAEKSLEKIVKALGLENGIEPKTQYEPNDVAKSINNFICGADECTDNNIKNSLIKFAGDPSTSFGSFPSTNIVGWLETGKTKVDELLEIKKSAEDMYKLWIPQNETVNNEVLKDAYKQMESFCGKTANCLEATRQEIQKVANSSGVVLTQNLNELGQFSLESLQQVAEKIESHKTGIAEILKLVNGQEMKEDGSFDLVKVIVEALKGVLKCEKEPCNNNVEAYFKETEQIFNKIAGVLGIKLSKTLPVELATEFNQEVQKYLCGDVKCEETIASISKLHKGLDEKLKSRINLPEPPKPPNNHSLPDLFNAIAESWKKDLEQLESLESLNKGSEELGKQVSELETKIKKTLEAKTTLEKQNSEYLQRIDELSEKIRQLELGNQRLSEKQTELEKNIKEQEQEQKKHKEKEESIKQEIKKLQESYFKAIKEVGQLENNFQEQERQKDDLEKKLEEENKRLSELKKSVEEAQEENKRKSKELEERQKEKARLEKEKEELEKRISIKGETIRELVKAIQTLQSGNKQELEQDLQNLQQEITSKEQELEELGSPQVSKDLEYLTEQKETFSRQVEEAKRELSEREKEKENLTRELEILNNMSRKLTEENNKCVIVIDRLGLQKTKISEEVEKLGSDISKNETEIKKLGLDIQKFGEDKSRQEQILEKHQTTLEEKQKELEILKEENQKGSEKVSGIQKEIDQITEQIKEKETYLNNQKRLQEKLEQGLQTLQGTLQSREEENQQKQELVKKYSKEQETLKQDIQSLTQENEKLEKEAETLLTNQNFYILKMKQLSQKRETELVSIKEQEKELKIKIERLGEAITQQDLEVAKAKEDREQLQSQIERLKQSLNEEKQVSLLEPTELKEKIKTMKREISELKEKNQKTLDQQSQKLNTKLVELMRTRDELASRHNRSITNLQMQHRQTAELLYAAEIMRRRRLEMKRISLAKSNVFADLGEYLTKVQKMEHDAKTVQQQHQVIGQILKLPKNATAEQLRITVNKLLSQQSNSSPQINDLLSLLGISNVKDGENLLEEFLSRVNSDMKTQARTIKEVFATLFGDLKVRTLVIAKKQPVKSLPLETIEKRVKKQADLSDAQVDIKRLEDLLEEMVAGRMKGKEVRALHVTAKEMREQILKQANQLESKTLELEELKKDFKEMWEQDADRADERVVDIVSQARRNQMKCYVEVKTIRNQYEDLQSQVKRVTKSSNNKEGLFELERLKRLVEQLPYGDTESMATVVQVLYQGYKMNEQRLEEGIYTGEGEGEEGYWDRKIYNNTVQTRRPVTAIATAKTRYSATPSAAAKSGTLADCDEEIIRWKKALQTNGGKPDQEVLLPSSCYRELQLGELERYELVRVPTSMMDSERIKEIPLANLPYLHWRSMTTEFCKLLTREQQDYLKNHQYMSTRFKAICKAY